MSTRAVWARWALAMAMGPAPTSADRSRCSWRYRSWCCGGVRVSGVNLWMRVATRKQSCKDSQAAGGDGESKTVSRKKHSTHQPIQFHKVCHIHSAGPRSSTYPAGRQPMKIFAFPVMPARNVASAFST